MRLTKEQREVLKGKYGGVCAYCGSKLGDRWHADHLQAVRRESEYVKGVGLVKTNGMKFPELDTLENLVPACKPCNIDKSVYPLEEWRAKLQRSCEVLRNNQPTYRHALRFGLVKEEAAIVVFYFERENQASKGVD